MHLSLAATARLHNRKVYNHLQPAARGLMAGPTELASLPKKDYEHYNHTDPYRLYRWTAKECYEFMYARPWEKVNAFYADMVTGRVSLLELFGKGTCATHDDPDLREEYEPMSIPAEDKTGRWARATFKIVLSYHGASFDGWQKQPGLDTVQGLVERSLGKFVDEKKAQLLREKNLPVEGCAVVAGRTDKGVTAFKQVCSFYTWRKNVKIQEIEDSINNAAAERIRVLSVSKVSREFHPNFSAHWRRYLYIFPLDDGAIEDQAYDHETAVMDIGEHVIDSKVNDEVETQKEKKPTSFQVNKVDQLLYQLEGKKLSYRMFARDTKASRNMGPPTECFVYHARATEVLLPCVKDESSIRTMCIELVANRFLRKMVRVLVATVVREVAAGAEEDALLKLMDATCRRATAPPAPPDGLCLVDVGYAEFDRSICFIH